MLLQLGIPVRCTDGPCGELGDVVIDPATRRVTHLVVEPHHGHALARLVPIEQADVDPSGEANSAPSLSLRCTSDELHLLTQVEESAYVGVALPGDGHTDLSANPGWDDPHVLIPYDTVPSGEAEIRRRSAVTSADGHHLGHVDALVVDAGHKLTELVFERRRGWAVRRVTIPIDAIARVEADSVTLNLTKAAVRAL
jgi:sporulation protein YlmC with PRC-barrel domain